MATRHSARSRTGASGSDAAAVDPALPQKQRARHRLIGALVLCALAAVVVPLLLESEPARPVNDLPIAIPSKDTPLPPRAAATPSSPAASPAANVTAPAATATAPATPATTAAAPAAPSGGSTATVPGAAPKVEPERAKSGAVARGTIEPATPANGSTAGATVEAAKRSESRTPSPSAEPAKDEIQQIAEARLRGETVGRYLLQVGAFATESSANAAVGRVQAAGQRAFTERVKTERGERIRVRVGPFASREAAERARDTLKAAGIDAAMIAP